MITYETIEELLSEYLKKVIRYIADVKSTFFNVLMWWRKERLRPLKVVLNTMPEYRTEMDVFGDFIRERCVQKAEVNFKAKELFKCYQEWYDENNERDWSECFQIEHIFL